VATVTRLVGDLDIAEDAVQEACALAVERWPADGTPANPRAWLIGVARHKAIDRIRREARRPGKEAPAVRDLGPGFLSVAAESAEAGSVEARSVGDDELALIFACCHPALAREVRMALTLRAVAGLSTAEIATVFLVPTPTMAKRLVRAKDKIRRAGISFRVPAAPDRPRRLADVLRVLYLIFTAGHHASSGPDLVRGEVCDTAIRLARSLARLLPDEPEAIGLLALLLLTDGRRPARTSAAGELVLLEDQDRGLWDRALIAEGETLLLAALTAGRPGPYQLWAAIAACHSTAPTARDTDWRQIAALYGELIRYEPTAVVEANRAIAVAMAEGPAAGLVILDVLSAHPQLSRWPQLHMARADLLRRLDRGAEAAAAYRIALELEPAPAERAFIGARLSSFTEGGQELAWPRTSTGSPTPSCSTKRCARITSDSGPRPASALPTACSTWAAAGTPAASRPRPSR
jgi:RNA polymerase sigma-70 factor (ECF subfamily)